MSAFYNEKNLFAAQWLRNLIDAGEIAPGVVDTRDVKDIEPHELAGYTQCHFFAGIGVWSHALRRAGWPDERPVWTGSCPCQPFSASGRRGGFADERHLWPHWFHLIERAKPRAVPVFGEQVASKDGLAWLDLVLTDLEGTGHATAAFDLCAAGVGAPHIRQRFYFVADAVRWRSEVADQHDRSRAEACSLWQAGLSGVSGGTDRLGNVDDSRLEGHAGDVHVSQRWEVEARPTPAPGRCNGFWSNAEWIGPGADGKWRPIEPGIEPLAHGSPTLVGELQAYGNALVGPLAAEFVGAFLDIS